MYMLKSTSKLDKYSISKEQLAEIFNYANVNSFYNSSAYEDRIKSAELLISIVERKITSWIEG